MTKSETGGRPAAAARPGSLAYGRAAPEPLALERVARRSRFVFVLAVAAGLASFLAWAATTEIDTVTRGMGAIVPGEANQTIQHFEGGIVSGILKREGDRIRKGEPIIRVTDQRWVSGLEQARFELAAKRAERARHIAEASGADRIAFPEDFDDARARTIEETVFAQRRANLSQRLLIFDDQVRRKKLELSELKTRLENVEVERDLIEQRVQSLTTLSQRGAVSRNDLLSAMTSLQQVKTRIADIQFQIPQLEAELSETTRRRVEVVSEARAEANAAIAEIDLEIARLEESVATLRDRQRRSDVVSPVTGVINKLFVSTIGGVVREGQVIAEIVPTSDELRIDVRLSPEDRARVWPGMRAVARITAYDYSAVGGLDAEVEEISADALKDERGGAYFRVTLIARQTSFGPDKPVLPGMVASVDMISAPKTILAALIEPLSALKDRALRE